MNKAREEKLKSIRDQDESDLENITLDDLIINEKPGAGAKIEGAKGLEKGQNNDIQGPDKVEKDEEV